MLWLILLILMSGFLVKQASVRQWAIMSTFMLFIVTSVTPQSLSLKLATGLLCLICLIGSIKPIRRTLISTWIIKRMRLLMPSMSVTERVALEAGTVGWDAALFSGDPDFKALLARQPILLTQEEQAFLDGPLNTLCRMLDDWEITHYQTDLPEHVWTYIKDNGFLGLIIPKAYDGLELSATAQVAVLVRLYGRSVSAATTIAVPNSLGPAELLLKYGTDTQKNYYLPRLARGKEIPCFALTGPNAGSDAASIPDTGIVCEGDFQGKAVVGIRLNWDKRYITLCPVATVIGLAFHLYDPDNRLGQGEDIGITCALIPANTPGITKGRRHFPLNSAFLNGPTQGKDVFIPLDYIIGGVEMVGHGWRMLMECLSVGRAISLPSAAAGCALAGAAACGAYGRVRKQFNMPIGKFEGIEEPLARIAGNGYMIDAAITMTVAAIDEGEKPSVAGAILKYHSTERARQVSLDAMDIHGGKGICLGPNNYLGRSYQASPISITVEGANILTRSLIIFGQGAIRCHPYLYQEMKSIAAQDVASFDKAFWGHVGFTLANATKTWLFSLTDARFCDAPSGPTQRYFQLVHQYSTQLAFLADFSMITLGATLKRREKISARLGDILSDLYFASAVLLRFSQDGKPKADKILVDWCCQTLLYECEQAIHGVIENFPTFGARVVLKLMLQPFGLRRKKPKDKLGQALAKLMIEPNETRSRLLRHVYLEAGETCPIGRLEEAFHLICEVEPLEKRIAAAVKQGQLKALTLMNQIEEAKLLGVLTSDEALQLLRAEEMRQHVIAVDDFDDTELRRSPKN
jgi:acyl-CoA dehydrogenase